MLIYQSVSLIQFERLELRPCLAARWLPQGSGRSKHEAGRVKKKQEAGRRNVNGHRGASLCSAVLVGENHGTIMTRWFLTKNMRIIRWSMKPSLDISCCWWIDGTQSDSLQLNLQPLQLEKWAASKTGGQSQTDQEGKDGHIGNRLNLRKFQ